jgi:hypothetical protein
MERHVGLIHFMASTTCMYLLMAYKNTIRNRVYTLCGNMIYWYSYMEVHIKNAIKPYMRDPSQIHEEKDILFYLKDNYKVVLKRHRQTITLPETMDLMIYASSGLHMVVDIIDNEDKWVNNSKIKSDTEFINITVIFDNDPEPYDISLNTGTINLYAVGNRINKYIIWYLVKNQHDVERYGIPYSIQLMDHDVNIAKYNENTTIVIQKVGYYIEQGECPCKVTVPVTKVIPQRV